MADFAITKPTVGGSSGTWGTELNAALDVLVAHPGIKVVADAATKTAYVPLLGQLLLQADTGTLYKCTNATGPVWEVVGSGASPLTTKGDVYVYGSADARLPVGTNGQVLTADSAQALGVKWAAPAATNGVPIGGTAGQILEKIDGTDYNAQWVDLARLMAVVIFGGTASASERTETGCGVKFLSLVDYIATGVAAYTVWTSGVTFTAKLWDSSNNILASGTFSGDGTTAWKEIDFSAEIQLSKFVEYYISIERTSDSIAKYYLEGSYPTAFLVRTATFSGLPTSQSASSDAYAIGLKMAMS